MFSSIPNRFQNILLNVVDWHSREQPLRNGAEGEGRSSTNGLKRRALSAEVYNVSRANLGQVQFQLCTSLVLRCLKVETALMFVDFKEVTFGLKNIS